jgi:hypothetical protein
MIHPQPKDAAMQYHYEAALPPGFTREAFQQPVELRGAGFVQRIPRGPQQLEEDIWLLADGRGALRYIYDHFVDVAVARAESDVFGRPADIMREFEPVLPFLYTGALMKLTASKDPATRAHAISALAVTTRIYGADVFGAIRDALFDDDPHMRHIAMKAIARWPYFRFARELDRLAETEVDPELKREAVRLAQDLREHGRRSLT